MRNIRQKLAQPIWLISGLFLAYPASAIAVRRWSDRAAPISGVARRPPSGGGAAIAVWRWSGRAALRRSRIAVRRGARLPWISFIFNYLAYLAYSAYPVHFCETFGKSWLSLSGLFLAYFWLIRRPQSLPGGGATAPPCGEAQSLSGGGAAIAVRRLATGPSCG